jgi:tetratricopeptide (TPR) repeat protein
MSSINEIESQAELHRAEGKVTEEIACWNEILTADESFVRAHLGLAVAYYKAQDFEASVRHAERACQLEPDDAFNYTALSVTYQRAFAGTNDPSYIQKAENARDLAHQVRAQ